MGGNVQLQEENGPDSFTEWTKEPAVEEGYYFLRSATPRYYASQKHGQSTASCVWLQIGAENEYFYLQSKETGHRLKCQTATIDEHAGQIVPITPKTPALSTTSGGLKKTFSFRDETIANSAAGRSRRYTAVGPGDAVGKEYQWTWEKVPPVKLAAGDPLATGSADVRWMLVSRHAKENPGPSMKQVAQQRNERGEEQQQQVWISPKGQLYADPVDANYWFKNEADAAWADVAGKMFLMQQLRRV
jgi:hypothetical protein